MNIYVFENVLTDYTGGMCMIAASSLERAIELAMAEHPDYVRSEPGWQEPTGVYPSPGAREGILHECWGGG